MTRRASRPALISTPCDDAGGTPPGVSTLSSSPDGPVRGRALITGASGFIGTALARRLLAEGFQVAGLARHVAAVGFELAQADVRDLDKMTAIFQRVAPTHVFHLAGARRRYGFTRELPTSFAVNAQGTVNVVTAAAVAGCQRVVVLGTAEEYGPIASPYSEEDRELPTTPYGISKLAGTRAALAAGSLSETEVVVLRATVVYGVGQPKDMFISGLLQALFDGSLFPMTSGEQTRDFLYIDNLVEGLMRAASMPGIAGQIINLGSGESITVRAAAELCERVTGVFGLLKMGATRQPDAEATKYAVDLDKARRTLGWEWARSLEQGITETVRVLRS